MRKKILIVAANHWTSPYQVGSHHYARIFAKNGWEVLFISDPISPFHFLLGEKKQVQERYRIYRNKVESGYQNIKIYVPMALFTPKEKPFFRSRLVTDYWYKLTIPDVVKYVKAAGFGTVDLLWFDSIIQYFWIEEIRYNESILRISDIMDAFKKNTLNVKKLEERLKNKVDHIVFTSETLKPYFKGFEKKAAFVPNGVDMDHFINSKKEVPDDLKKIPRPRAIYVGAVEEWFGVDFLAEVAKKSVNTSFVIIGNPRIDISKLKKLPNIYFLGRKDYMLIPSYLYSSDIGIIVFNVKHPVVKSVNPIKLYEYMACGLPVVSTKWDELEKIKSPAYLAENPDSFVDKLNLALKDRDKSKSLGFAKENSWEIRFKIIESLLNS